MRQVVYVVSKTNADGDTDVTVFNDPKTALRYQKEWEASGDWKGATVYERKVWIAHEAKVLFDELRSES